MGRQVLVGVLYSLVGFVNFVPFVGLAGQKQLEHMYAISVSSPELVLLMQHRAVLLAIVGALLLAATVHRHLRKAAVIAALVSMGSFVAVWESSGLEGSKLALVSTIDMAAIVLLLIALLLETWGGDAVPDGEVKA